MRDNDIEQIAIKQSLRYSSDIKTSYTNKIKINIVNNKIESTYTEAGKILEWRIYACLEFIEDAINSYNKSISLSITICLDDVSHEDNIMVCSGYKDTQILIPDFYSIVDKTAASIDDTMKNNKAIFIGVTTGSYDPIYNERLKICNKYKENENVNLIRRT